MRFIKTIRSLSVAMAAFGLLAIAATTASADDCVRLGGASSGGECKVTTAVINKSDLTAPGGPYTIDETLRITSTGSITIPTGTAKSLTLNINGDFIMEDGAKIIGDNGGAPNNNASAIAATITITAAGSITLEETSATVVRS